MTNIIEGKEYPSWFVWTGGWYQLNGEEDYYFNHPYLTDDSTVLEIGSYRGKFARGISDRYDCRVIGYEPSTFSYKAAVAEVSGRPKVTIHNLGISDRDETKLLYDTHRDSSNLLHAGEGFDEQVSLVDVAPVVRDIGYVDLFVVNCEGWEFPIFDRLIEADLLVSIDRMMIQWHAGSNELDARKWAIQETFSHTHLMEWNLGAWELWKQKGLQ